MAKDDIRGRWALVTGASSGLGVDFARELAKRGANVILVARREERLREVADELRDAHDVETEVLSMDLATEDAPERLHEAVAELGHDVDVLISNAGFGVYGDYLDIPWERERKMIQLDVATVAGLTKLFGRDMAERGWGRMLQVSSIGAYQPTPTYAAYSAAKSFVLSFSEAVSFELESKGVSSTAISPGVTATEFLEVSGQKKTLYQRLMMMKSGTVARIGIDAMLAGRRSVVPGLGNKLSAFFVRLIPRRLATWIAWLTMKDGGEGYSG